MPAAADYGSRAAGAAAAGHALTLGGAGSANGGPNM